MSKLDYNKAEKAFQKALNEIQIEQLSEVLSIAQLAHEEANLSVKTIDEIINRFRKQLKKLKKEDIKLYAKLELNPEEEERFSSSRLIESYSHDDWLILKKLRDRIAELKKELYGEEIIDVENDQIIITERRKHINKRFNVREGWLPLK